MSLFSQLRTLFLESLNKKSFIVMLLTAVIICGLAAYVIRYNMFGVFENAKVGFFILVCCSLWMGMFDSILSVCGNREVLERDKFSGLRPSTFVVASVVFHAWHALLQSAILFVITRVFIVWPTDAPFLLFDDRIEFFITVFLITFASQMLGLAVSAIVKRNDHALIAAPFLLIYELIMSETLFGLPSWIEPLRETTIVRWGLNAYGTIYDIDKLPWQGEGTLDRILANQAQEAVDAVQPYNIDPEPVREAIMNIVIDPSVMGVSHDLAEYTATATSLAVLWIGLGVLAFVCMIAAYIGFKRKVNVR